jgi:hypothetical protein
MLETFKIEVPRTYRDRKPIVYYIDENGCHICISHVLDKKGNPLIGLSGKQTRMSRYIWTIEKDIIPEGLCVCHSCDNPSCININHLWIGTTGDNTRDMIAKGRFPKKYGENARYVKLTNDQVKDILLSSDTLKELGNKYNVHPNHVWRIKKGKSWKHALEEAKC